MSYSRGPDYADSGDPEWIEPEIKAGGALEPDFYVGWGRWRARIFPPDDHISDNQPLALGLSGLAIAVTRLFEILGNLPSPLPDETGQNPGETPTVKAIVAVYDALEWVHSLNDHLTRAKTYQFASEIDAELGPYVEGLLAARNASHHGLRRVVGFVPVEMSIYKVHGNRWVHTGGYTDGAAITQLRWVRALPPRPEAGEQDRPVLRYADQIAAYVEHLAGRDVHNTFRAAGAFFFDAVRGRDVDPDTLYGPAHHPPPIDPDVMQRFSADSPTPPKLP